VERLYKPIPFEVIGVKLPDSSVQVSLHVPYGRYQFRTVKIVEKNGWSREDIKILSNGDYARVPLRGFIGSVNRK